MIDRDKWKQFQQAFIGASVDDVIMVTLGLGLLFLIGLGIFSFVRWVF